MTKDEISQKGTLKEVSGLSTFTLNLLVPYFNKSIKIEAFNLPNLDTSTLEFSLMTEIINEILTLSEKNNNWIKDELFKHYNDTITHSNYGMINYTDFDTDLEANKSYFKIQNSEMAFEKSELILIHFDLYFKDFRHFNLEFECPWEEEHNIILNVQNGEFNSIS
ncbi:conserved protein of unknown function [Tenacibaculum sp. 190524A02b]|uniref:DUF6985 domain-containing protein n=1 Tax=Tenacibaculum vairaonense TaxID=3137860 RepID=UPI0032B2978B